MRLIHRDFRTRLAALIAAARNDLLICSPYIGREGVDLFLSNTPACLRQTGRVAVLTDLSPINICQAATDVQAVAALRQCASLAVVRHLPRVHAKVYVADSTCAIITSANLTTGGLFRNYEYGIEIADVEAVARVRSEIENYGELGGLVTDDDLLAFCKVAGKMRESFQAFQRSVKRKLRQQFMRNLRQAEDKLIRIRLKEGALHTVFEKTIRYLLQTRGEMPTTTLHPLIESIHPDLCDNTVDRVIDGKRFGKKWKHAVRSAQQQLKRKGAVEYRDGIWSLTNARADETV